jgi:zinc D-Ala-D-Ala carboxypeptidase
VTSPPIPERPGWFFTWGEFSRSSAASRLGLRNDPRDVEAHWRAVVKWCIEVGDPLRRYLGRPIAITSGYRSEAVNRAIGGARSSQHLRGEAADIKVEGLSAEELAGAVCDSRVPFDQLIWYAPSRGGHVHVSVAARPRSDIRYGAPDGSYPRSVPRR